MRAPAEESGSPRATPPEGVASAPGGGALAACPPWFSSPSVQATGVFALAFLLRLLFLVEMAPHPLLDINLVPGTDMEGYLRWAQSIAAGNVLGWGQGPFWQGPAYPYFLALLFWLFGPDPMVVLAAQTLLGSATTLLIYATGCLLFSQWVGLLAGLLAGGYGMLVFFGVILHSTTLEVFLAAAAALALALASRRGGGWWFWAGLALGLAALARPNFLLAPPFVLAGLWIAGWRGARASLGRASLLFLAGVALVVLPVALRNVVVGKAFVVVSAAGPETFRIANSYDSTPLNFRYPALPRMPIASWAFWRHQLAKAGYFWWGFEVPQNVNYYLFRTVSGLLELPLVAYWAVVPLCAAGLWLSRTAWRLHLPLWLFGLAYYLSVVAFHIVGRFRLPLLPLLLVFAAHGMAVGWERLRRRRLREFAVGAAAVGLLMLGAYPWGISRIYPVDQGVYGYILANRGDLPGGLDRLAIAEEGLPGHPNLNYDMGRILLLLGRPAEALARFEREMRLVTANAQLYWRAGVTAGRLGERERAVRYLERSLALAPDGPHAEEIRRELAALRSAPPPHGGKPS